MGLRLGIVTVQVIVLQVDLIPVGQTQILCERCDVPNLVGAQTEPIELGHAAQKTDVGDVVVAQPKGFETEQIGQWGDIVDLRAAQIQVALPAHAEYPV